MSILRKWFGPSKEEIWRQLSTQIGGNFEPGGFWRKDKLHAAHREWIVMLDLFTQVVSTGKTTTVIHHTRMRAPYVNKDGFRFNIYRRGIFSDLGKLFGMQDVEVGHEEFDRAFIIKGNDEGKLRALFANPRIRELVAAQKTIHFCVKDDEGIFKTVFPEGVDELHFEVVGIIKDIERLKLLFDLFAETLDELCRIGSAYEQSPNVTL